MSRLRRRIAKGLARARKERAREIDHWLHEAHRTALAAAQQSDGHAYADLIAFARYENAQQVEVRTYPRATLRQNVDRPEIIAMRGLIDEINQPDPPGTLRIVVQLPDGECRSTVLPVPEQEIRL